MTECIACSENKSDKEFAGGYSIKDQPLCDRCYEFDNDYVDVCARCGAAALAEDEEIVPVIDGHAEYFEDETGRYVDTVERESQTKYCDDCFDEAVDYAAAWDLDSLDERKW